MAYERELREYSRLVGLGGTYGFDKITVTPEVYKEKLEIYKAEMDEYEIRLKVYNEDMKNYTAERFAADFSTLMNDWGVRDNNVEFTLKGGSKFVTPKNVPEHTSIDSKVFNPSAYEQGGTEKILGKMGRADAYAVRIPRGGSVTIDYTKKDGSDYSTYDHFPETKLVKEREYGSTRWGEFNTSFQPINKIRLTIHNDGSISRNGDLIMYITNDLGSPIYHGLARTLDEQFAPSPDGRFYMVYSKDIDLYNKEGDKLIPVNTETVIRGDKYYINGGLKRGDYVPGNLTSIDKKPTVELVGVPKTSTNSHGIVWQDKMVPVGSLEYQNLPSDWKDKYLWVEEKAGFVGTTVRVSRKLYERKLASAEDIDGKTQTSRHGVISTYRVTYDVPEPPTRPLFIYKTDLEQPVAPIKPKEPVAKTAEKPVEPVKPTEPTPTAGEQPTRKPKREVAEILVPKPVKGRPKEPIPPVLKEFKPKALPQKLVLKPEPPKPTLKQVPVAPTDGVDLKLEEVPKPPKLKEVPPLVQTRGEKPTVPKYEPLPEYPKMIPTKPDVSKEFGELEFKKVPKKPTLEIKRVTYEYIKRTRWETIHAEILKPWTEYTQKRILKDTNSLGLLLTKMMIFTTFIIKLRKLKVFLPFG